MRSKALPVKLCRLPLPRPPADCDGASRADLSAGIAGGSADGDGVAGAADQSLVGALAGVNAAPARTAAARRWIQRWVQSSRGHEAGGTGGEIVADLAPASRTGGTGGELLAVPVPEPDGTGGTDSETLAVPVPGPISSRGALGAAADARTPTSAVMPPELSNDVVGVRANAPELRGSSASDLSTSVSYSSQIIGRE